MNIYKTLFSLIVFSLLSNCCGVRIINGSYKGCESESYTILRKDDKIEIRQYYSTTVAKVDAEAERSLALAQGQEILYDYFSEKNNFEEKMNMTTPLIQKGQGRQWKIYLTTPINYTIESAVKNEAIQLHENTAKSSKLKALLLTENQESNASSIPQETIDSSTSHVKILPIPLDEKVQILTTKPSTIIAIVFSGFVTDKNLNKNLQELENYIAKENIKVIRPHFYAFYDSALTLPFNRRTEILFTLSDDRSNNIFKKTR